MLDAVSLQAKDFLLGFFIALALRRDRIRTILDTKLPTPTDEPNSNE